MAARMLPHKKWPVAILLYMLNSKHPHANAVSLVVDNKCIKNWLNVSENAAKIRNQKTPEWQNDQRD